MPVGPPALDDARDLGQSQRMNSTKRPFDRVPTPEIVANSNRSAFIRKTGEPGLAAPSRRADAVPAWLIQQVFECCDFRFYTPPQLMLDTCRLYTAQRAVDMGPINEVMKAQDLDATVDGLCQDIPDKSPQSTSGSPGWRSTRAPTGSSTAPASRPPGCWRLLMATRRTWRASLRSWKGASPNTANTAAGQDGRARSAGPVRRSQIAQGRRPGAARHTPDRRLGDAHVRGDARLQERLAAQLADDQRLNDFPGLAAASADQPPLNTGLRFSRNARAPSWWSSLVTARVWPHISAAM